MLDAIGRAQKNGGRPPKELRGHGHGWTIAQLTTLQ
jgi:hypothetical protein